MFFFHKIEVALALSYDGWLWLTGVRIRMPMNLLMHVQAISCIRWSFKESFSFSGNTPKATYLRACLCFWGNAADNPSIFWWLLFTSDWWTSFSTRITLLKTSSFLNKEKCWTWNISNSQLSGTEECNQNHESPLTVQQNSIMYRQTFEVNAEGIGCFQEKLDLYSVRK